MEIIKSYHFLGANYSYSFYLWSNNKISKHITLFNEEGEVISMDKIEITGVTLEEVILNTITLEIG